MSSGQCPTGLSGTASNLRTWNWPNGSTTTGRTWISPSTGTWSSFPRSPWPTTAEPLTTAARSPGACRRADRQRGGRSALTVRLWGYVCWDFLGVHRPGTRYRRGDNLMTTATPTRSRRGSPQSADKRHARQDELMGALADGVQALTTSDGWRRYLRAMSTLRTYSTGNTHISESREYPPSVAAERVPAAAPLASTIATEGRG